MFAAAGTQGRICGVMLYLLGVDLQRECFSEVSELGCMFYSVVIVYVICKEETIKFIKNPVTDIDEFMSYISMECVPCHVSWWRCYP